MIFDRIVLVSGSRERTNKQNVFDVLDSVDNEAPITLLVHGACARGVDQLAQDWAVSREKPYLGMPAKWNTGVGYRKSRGNQRNRDMAVTLEWIASSFDLEIYTDPLLVAFPNPEGSGTQDMIRWWRKTTFPLFVDRLPNDDTEY